MQAVDSDIGCRNFKDEKSMTELSREKVKAIVYDTLSKRGRLPENIDQEPNFNFVENGVVDSLGIISLVSELEDALNIELQEDDFLKDNFRQIGGLVDILLEASARH
jgi:acyl carrier protein